MSRLNSLPAGPRFMIVAQPRHRTFRFDGRRVRNGRGSATGRSRVCYGAWSGADQRGDDTHQETNDGNNEEPIRLQALKHRNLVAEGQQLFGHADR